MTRTKTNVGRALSLFVTLSVLAASIFVAGCADTKANKQPLTPDPAIVSGKLDNGMSYFIQRNTEPANRIMLRLVIRADRWVWKVAT